MRLACDRYLDDLEHAGERGLRFDAVRAERAILFFELFLCHSKGEWAGRPFVPDPWEQFILANLFGWIRADGTRRFREAYIEIPKKNGKSTFCAGIGLEMLVADGEPGAEVYAFATTKDQAKIIHEEAVRMWEKSESLQRRVGKFRNNLHVRSSNSKFEPLSSDEGTNDGLNPSCGLGDELHRHPTNALWNLISMSGASRRQPLMIGITTAGTDRVSFCYQQHDYAEKILNRVLENDSFFVYISAMDLDENGSWRDHWQEPEQWERANPSYGRSVKVDKLEEEARQAKDQPTMLNDFLRFRLNVWTQGSNRALSPEKWRLCTGELLDGETPQQVLERWKRELVGCRCYAGLDAATVDDVASLVLYFPKADDNPHARVIPFFFCPAEAILERSKKARVPYDVWNEQGFITMTPGQVIDYKAIRQTFLDCNEQYQILETGFDRYEVSQLVTQLEEDDGLTMVRVGQGFVGISAATKEFLKMVVASEFWHGGNPVLTWMADNFVTRSDPAGLIKPDKEKAREKIDGIVAFIDAISRSIAQSLEDDDAPAVYRL